LPWDEKCVTSAVAIVLRFAIAAESLAACRERNKLGIATVPVMSIAATVGSRNNVAAGFWPLFPMESQPSAVFAVT
jgi:hypothetical protein